MSRSDEQRVADIREAGAELAAVVSLGRTAFLEQSLCRRAAERLLEIIGEAANQLSEDFTAQRAEVPWRDIAALRIRLAHHYHRIDPEQVWVIASEHLPALLRSLDDPSAGADR